jgi:hypothetical protein
MVIDLSENEALVLFDMLQAYEEQDDPRLVAVRHAAERNALWALSAQLEKRLIAPFRHDYDELLEEARSRVEEQGGLW